MPRFKANRWWTFILALSVLSALAISRPGSTIADVSRGDSRSPGSGDGTSGGGGVPTPGIGDPDQPQGGSIKKGSGQFGGLQYSRNASLSMRSVGDSRELVGNVWMWRLTVMARVLRISLIRY